MARHWMQVYMNLVRDLRADAGLSTNGINWIEKLGLDQPASGTVNNATVLPIMFKAINRIASGTVFTVYYKGKSTGSLKVGDVIKDTSNPVYQVIDFTEKKTNILVRSGLAKTMDVSELLVRDLASDKTFVMVLGKTNYTSSASATVKKNSGSNQE